MLLSRDRSLLLVIDVQEKLTPLVEDPRGLLFSCVKLLRGAAILGVPALMSTQYAKGLGPVMPDLRDAAPDVTALDKQTISCWRDEDLKYAITQSGRDHMVLAGIETHACIMQTALDLKAAGYTVAVVANAVSSRFSDDRVQALDRMTQQGVLPASVEMVLFEWLERSGTEEFRIISQTLLR